MRNIIKLSDSWQKEEAKDVFSSLTLPYKQPIKNAPESLTLRRKIYIPKEDKNEEFFLEIKGLSGRFTAYIENTAAGKEECFIAPKYIDLTNLIKKGEDQEIKLEIFPEANPNGDFTFFEASVICVPRSHFNVTLNNDPISVTTEFTENGVKIGLSADIINPNNYDVVIFRLIQPNGQAFEAKTSRPTEGAAEFFIEEPLRWDGVHSAYKYETEVILQRDSEIIDTALKSFGIREFKAEKDGFFKLNGIKLPLGGSAVRSCENIEKHIEYLKELDANLVLLDYIDPEEKILQKCDELGLMVFFLFSQKGSFDELKRITRMLSSHPSAAFTAYTDSDPAAAKKFCSAVKSCSENIYTAGVCNILKGESLSDAIPDVLLLYADVPTEKGGYNELENRYNEIIAKHPDYRFAIFPEISEKNIVDGNAVNDFFSAYHERMWSIFGTKKNTVCYFTGYLTDKSETLESTGLIKADGKTKKDAFWFYKAQFSADKFIKIASLPETVTKKRITVKCYTNSSLPVLHINGKTKKRLLPAKLFSGVYQFEGIRLKRKENSIVLSGGDKTDSTQIYRRRSKKK